MLCSLAVFFFGSLLAGKYSLPTNLLFKNIRAFRVLQKYSGLYKCCIYASILLLSQEVDIIHGDGGGGVHEDPRVHEAPECPRRSREFTKLPRVHKALECPQSSQLSTRLPRSKKLPIVHEAPEVHEASEYLRGSRESMKLPAAMVKVEA